MGGGGGGGGGGWGGGRVNMSGTMVGQRRKTFLKSTSPKNWTKKKGLKPHIWSFMIF